MTRWYSIIMPARRVRQARWILPIILMSQRRKPYYFSFCRSSKVWAIIQLFLRETTRIKHSGASPIKLGRLLCMDRKREWNKSFGYNCPNSYVLIMFLGSKRGISYRELRMLTFKQVDLRKKPIVGRLKTRRIETTEMLEVQLVKCRSPFLVLCNRWRN